jgi:hypothetical protein
MEKSNIIKVLAILLAILFVMSLTAVAVSARGGGGFITAARISGTTQSGSGAGAHTGGLHGLKLADWWKSHIAVLMLLLERKINGI